MLVFLKKISVRTRGMIPNLSKAFQRFPVNLKASDLTLLTQAEHRKLRTGKSFIASASTERSFVNPCI